MVRTPPRRGRKSGDSSDNNTMDNVVLSPLSRSRWDSPPDNPSNRSTPTKTRSTPTSSQRKLFGFGLENVENDNKSIDQTDMNISTSKTKVCKKSRGRCNSKDKGEIATKSHVAFSELFPVTSSAASSSTHKSLLMGPRLSLSRRQTPFDDIFDFEENSNSELLPGAPNNSSSTTASAPAVKLGPKSPCLKKKSSTKKHNLSPRREPTSPLHPPRLSFNNDFALTPTVLYNGPPRGGHHYNHRPLTMSATSSSNSQHYLKSPHWSGQVRINPFSPVPEQYLRPPPTSTKSATRGGTTSRSNLQHPGFYKLIDLEPPAFLTTDPAEIQLAPRRKKARLNLRPSSMLAKTSSSALAIPPRLSSSSEGVPDFFSEISPTDVTQSKDVFDIDKKLSGAKRKAAPEIPMNHPPPQSIMEGDSFWAGNTNLNGNKRMRIKRGRYLDDFQEVKFLGAGSFGSVNACLSRLDGCMYAVKSISPSGQIKKGNDNTGVNGEGEGAEFLYGGLKMMSNQCTIPPTPRRDLVPTPLLRKKPMGIGMRSMDASEMTDDCYDLGVLEGSNHWNEGALRRMLREVFALAALCQQDDVRTFHVVRYQQAWLEDDGTLYIQTELCSATLRDEMSGKVAGGSGMAVKTAERDPTTGKQTLDVFRQLKVLREILLALELVHEKGMVHLDIKPENIFVKNNLFKVRFIWSTFYVCYPSQCLISLTLHICLSSATLVLPMYSKRIPIDLPQLQTLRKEIHATCQRTCWTSNQRISPKVISFHWVQQCMKLFQDGPFPCVVKSGKIYVMENCLHSLAQCHASTQSLRR